MSATPCPVCGCDRAEGSAAHAVAGALAGDDLDRAIESGLLSCNRCDGCTSACTTTLLAARETRQRALAARSRFRAREERLQRRANERAAARIIPAPSPAPGDTVAPKPGLPSAAAAALARAKAKAAGRTPS
ncbi:MAG TPA: hypothetical protein VGD21_09570 [Lysobacter sp.]